MSRVLEKITQHQKFIESDGATPMTYSMMVAADLIKPYSIRLPVTTLAQLDDIYSYGAWETKQEMYFDILRDFIVQYLESPSISDEQKQTCMDAAKRSFEEWKAHRQLEAQA